MVAVLIGMKCYLVYFFNKVNSQLTSSKGSLWALQCSWSECDWCIFKASFLSLLFADSIYTVSGNESVALTRGPDGEAYQFCPSGCQDTVNDDGDAPQGLVRTSSDSGLTDRGDHDLRRSLLLSSIWESCMEPECSKSYSWNFYSGSGFHYCSLGNNHSILFYTIKSKARNCRKHSLHIKQSHEESGECVFYPLWEAFLKD